MPPVMQEKQTWGCNARPTQPVRQFLQALSSVITLHPLNRVLKRPTRNHAHWMLMACYPDTHQSKPHRAGYLGQVR